MFHLSESIAVLPATRGESKARPALAAARGPLYAKAMGSLNRTVALVGIMGAGKSSIGRRLATRLEVPFRDADAEIEAAAGCSIPEIFARFGEPEFRDGERRVIQRLLKDAPHVLATGGGALLNAETRARIANETFSIWLRAPLDLLVARVERRDTRPLLRDGNPRATLEKLLQEREPLYAQANLVIDAEDGPHHVAVDRIVKVLTQQGILEK
jgi:shikimate kinase